MANRPAMSVSEDTYVGTCKYTTHPMTVCVPVRCRCCGRKMGRDHAAVRISIDLFGDGPVSIAACLACANKLAKAKRIRPIGNTK